MRMAIGDIHGRPYWKNYLGRDFTDFYILGDYFDGYTTSFEQEYKNFEGICEAARKDSRLKLCFGNHDYHYLRGIPMERYSRFQDKHYRTINEILEQNMDMMKAVYVTSDNYIISHAGLSNVFLEKMHSAGVKNIEGINEAFKRDRGIFAFNGRDIYGDDPTQSLIWIRPKSLISHPVLGFNQIVGHTQFREIKVIEHSGMKFAFIDTGEKESIYEF
ncbi:MAG: metallophosphoesterase [Spirochaetaceae bacterium]|nr:metallophosphoesterase [Spirochaetaceae bacterium]